MCVGEIVIKKAVFLTVCLCFSLSLGASKAAAQCGFNQHNDYICGGGELAAPEVAPPQIELPPPEFEEYEDPAQNALEEMLETLEALEQELQDQLDNPLQHGGDEESIAEALENAIAECEGEANYTACIGEATGLDPDALALAEAQCEGNADFTTCVNDSLGDYTSQVTDFENLYESAQASCISEIDTYTSCVGSELGFEQEIIDNAVAACTGASNVPLCTDDIVQTAFEEALDFSVSFDLAQITCAGSATYAACAGDVIGLDAATILAADVTCAGVEACINDFIANL